MHRREWVSGALAFALGCGGRGSNSQAQTRTHPTPEPSQGTPAAPSRLRLLTYNVLADEVALDRRIPALLRAIKHARPDVIALQEVAPWFLDWIAGSAWLSEYKIASIEGRPARPNGQLIVSRLPITETWTRQLSGAQRRAALFARIELGPEDSMCIATTHMESYLEDGPTRAKQLDEIFVELELERSRSNSAVFCGDLNFGEGEQPDTAHLDPAFLDLWLQLHPHDPGYTWDIEHSEMARAGSFVGEASRRLDRVLLRSTTWQPAAIEIIGDQPVEPGDRRLFPSDHFGLVAELVRT